MRELSLFSGAGGGILAGQILGWRTVCAVEIDQYCRDVLVARQNDGSLDPFPVWDDVRTFRSDNPATAGMFEALRKIPDLVISGGFPCTDISCAGKGAGIEGEQSGLWSEMRRIIGEVRPRYVFIENSPMLTVRGGTRVIADLAEMGFDCRWGVLGAHHTGAPHKRDRIWIVAHSQPQGSQGSGRPGEENGGGKASRTERPGEVPHAGSTGLEGHPGDEQGGHQSRRNGAEEGGSTGKESFRPGQYWWATEPGLGGVIPVGMGNFLDIHGASEEGSVPRLGEGIRSRTDRLKAIGNGQVPACAALAWRILNDGV